MLPENIDDLFREKLDGHSTTPGDTLWARLQAAPANDNVQPAAEPPAEHLDQLFRSRLTTHPTPPGRALWERLEDEHLRPRRRRAAAWWPLALVAAVALFLLAGGAGLWLGFPLSHSVDETVASHPAPEPNRNGERRAVGSPRQIGASIKFTREASVASAAIPPALLTKKAFQAADTAFGVANSKKMIAQATRPDALASTAPKASTTATGQRPPHLRGTRWRPDAAAASLPLVARAAPRLPAAEAVPVPPAPMLAAGTPRPAAENVSADLLAAAGPASSAALITVDVRTGAVPAPRLAQRAASALAEGPEEHRRLGGRLLQQAGHLLRGERVSLAEVTGLPENLTLRATIAGRSVSKSIQL